MNRALMLSGVVVTTAFAPASSAQSIASRSAMTCAVRASGAVYCWGYFDRQQPSDAIAPTLRTRDARAVVVGLSRACAVRNDGAVLCWGADGAARVVDGLGGVRALAGGVEPLCALLADGSVRCADSTQSTLVFAPVPGLTGVEQIVSGAGHTCARLRDGSVRCWGDDSYNQLGDGRFGRSARPVIARQLGVVTELAAGDEFTCGRARDGRVSCVGSQFDATGSPRRRTPWTPAVLPRAESLFASGSMVCGAQREGGVRCAGFNDVSAMGEGDYTLRYADGVIAGATDVRAGAIARRAVCVLDGASRVRCIGDDSRGALGGATGPQARGPVRVRDVEGATRLVASGSHTCAIVANGQVKCWGFDDPQDLFFTTGERTGVLGRRPLATALASVTGATDVQTDGATTAVRLADGSLLLWGAGPFEPMGRVEGAGRDRVVRVAPAIEQSQYALGIQHVFALTSAGAVLAAGSGQHGQWGAGAAIPSMSGDGWFRPRFEAVAALSGVRSIAAAWHTACAVSSDGSLRCWGENASLSLGAQSPRGAIASAVRRDEGQAVEQVALGGHLSRVLVCARYRSGEVGCWGANDQWQTGSSGPRDRAEVTRVAVPAAVSIAAGPLHACSASRSGAVWCWGANHRGQCGAGPSGAPREVSGVSGAVEVAVGRAHSCARTRDGAVWCWGESVDGALGDGTSSYARDLIPLDLPE